jgi:WD40 repeat protein
VKKEGFTVEGKNLTFREGDREVFKATLLPHERREKNVILVVDVNEPNADVFVDGEKVTVKWEGGGKRAEILVKPGTHKVEVKKDGFTAYEEEVEIKDGPGKTVRATIMPREKPPAGLVAWWRADGNPRDGVGDNHGTLKGDVKYPPGVAGQAFRLDGASYVEVPRSYLWGFGKRDFSIELWVQFRALAPSRDIGHPNAVFIGCDEGNGPGRGRKWFFAYGGGLLNFHSEGGFYAKANFSPDIYQWYHLAVTRSRGTFTIYVNGAAVASEAVDLLIPDPDAPLTIGQAEGLGFVNGLIDEVAIYGRALRPEEVKARWSALAPTKYLTLPIDKVASAVSTKSLFSGGNHERLIFPTWGKQEVFGIPFDVIDPKGDSVKNAIVLYGPAGGPQQEMPMFVRLKCGSAAKAIHLLSGVAGNAYYGDGSQGPRSKKTVSVIVRLHYRDGGKEDHELRNGVHFCDIDAKVEVPDSRLAIRLLEAANSLNQMRYLAIRPKNLATVIEEIEFIKGMKDDVTAPVIMAVTVEKPGAPAEEGGEARRLVDRLVGHTDQPWKAGFLPDGKRVLSAGFDKVLRLWDAETGSELRRFDGHSEAIAALAISPDGRLALSGGGGSQTSPPAANWVSGKDLTVRLWDLTSGKKIRDFVGHTGIVWCLAFSPDGRRALSGSMDHTVRLWNVATGREVHRFQHNAWVMGVCFSPDGKRGLSSTENGDIVLWELETGRYLRNFKGHAGGVECVAFSPDGLHILSAGRDGTVRLWDVRREKEIRHLADNLGQQVHVAFSPDGRRALTAGTNHTFRLLDVETGKELIPYVSLGDGNVQCVAFSPDGRTALSVCHHDLTVRLWRLPKPDPASPAPPKPDGKLYLADLKEFGWVGHEKFLKGENPSGGVITANRKKYPMGISLHPPRDGYSCVGYRLDNLGADAFEAKVAIDDAVAVGSATPLIFMVLGDNKVLWRSSPIQAKGVIQGCRVKVKGIKVLELRVYCPGGHDFAHAVWLDPYLLSERR